MDCLHPKRPEDGENPILRSDAPDPKYYAADGAGASQRQVAAASKLAKLALLLACILAVVCGVLLGLVIWLAVEHHHTNDQITAIQLATTGLLSGSAVGSDAAGGTALGAFISANSTAPAGYTFGGSLYRGSGYWATQVCNRWQQVLPGCICARGGEVSKVACTPGLGPTLVLVVWLRCV